MSTVVTSDSPVSSILLSSGRRVVITPYLTGTYLVDMADGKPMTQAEWDEYAEIVRTGSASLTRCPACGFIKNLPNAFKCRSCGGHLPYCEVHAEFSAGPCSGNLVLLPCSGGAAGETYLCLSEYAGHVGDCPDCAASESTFTEEQIDERVMVLAASIKTHLYRLISIDPMTSGLNIIRLYFAAPDVQHFADLHEFMDANTLGDTEKVFGELEDAGYISAENQRLVGLGQIDYDEARVQSKLDVINAAQSEVDRWIIAGGLLI